VVEIVGQVILRLNNMANRFKIITSNGGLIKPLVDTLTGLQVQDTDGNTVFDVDTINKRVKTDDLHVNGSFTNYNEDLPDMGYISTSDIRGYGANYITDKSLSNVKLLEFNGTPTSGAIRTTTAGLFQVYLNGVWNNVVINFVLREDATYGYTFEHKPVGFTQYIEIMTGQSLGLLGLNGLPIINAYKVSMGAYPVASSIGGRTII
jgi:hypothetical protein